MVDHNSIDSLLHGPNSKFFLIGGVAVGALMFVEYRRTKAAAVPAVTATDPNAVDPSSDYGGYDVSGYDAAGTASLASYHDPATGATITGSGAQTILAPSSNSQWSQQVQAMLVSQGYDGQMVGAAIGHLLIGTEMTPDQWTLCQTAMALEGRPPEGFPPPKVAPSSSTPAAVVPADGYYIQQPTGLHYQVKGGKRYRLTAATVRVLTAQHVHWNTVLLNSPVFTLPQGSPYQI